MSYISESYASTGLSTGTNSLVIPYPATVNAGDWLIYGVERSNLAAIITPAGLTALVEVNLAGVFFTKYFYRIATGAEAGGSVTFTTAAGLSIFEGYVARYSPAGTIDTAIDANGWGSNWTDSQGIVVGSLTQTRPATALGMAAPRWPWTGWWVLNDDGPPVLGTSGPSTETIRFDETNPRVGSVTASHIYLSDPGAILASGANIPADARTYTQAAKNLRAIAVSFTVALVPVAAGGGGFGFLPTTPGFAST